MDHLPNQGFGSSYTIPLMADHHHHDEISNRDENQGASFDQQWLQQFHQQSESSSSQFLSSDPNLIEVGNDQLQEEEEEELGAMKEMMFKIAAMQPVDIDPATIRKPRRRNVRISEDPQSVAARHRRERISEKIRILQRLVPGGTKMDTASMLDEAIRYVKFLKRQIRILQAGPPPPCIGVAAAAAPAEDWAAAVAATPLSPYLFGGSNNAGVEALNLRSNSRPYELL